MDTYLTFELTQEYFAVPVTNVLEVMQKQHITHIPKAPEHVLGIINFRGNILPVIDTYQKFNLPKTGDSDKHVVIVFEITENDKKTEIAALADSVKDVIEINPSEIQPLPELGLSYNVAYISGAIRYKDNFILLLNIEKVFSGLEFENKINILTEQTESINL